MKALDELLEVIVSNPLLHAKWLNTVSYLEYVGFRKIVKSHHAENFSVDDLNHALEEGRHAMRLKKWALKLGGDDFRTYRIDDLFSKREADAYFQTLDRCCFEKTADQKTSYRYVTLLVEIRALNLYQNYERALQRHRLFSLNSLIQEEELHLAAMQSDLKKDVVNFESTFDDLKLLEKELYKRFIESVAALLEVEFAINI